MSRFQQEDRLASLEDRRRPDGRDRRDSARHLPMNRHAEIMWGPAESAPTAPAQLIDISRSGAAVIVGDPPPAGTLRLSLGAERTIWVEADVVAIEPVTESSHRLRLRFRTPCPDDFLKAAILD